MIGGSMCEGGMLQSTSFSNIYGYTYDIQHRSWRMKLLILVRRFAFWVLAIGLGGALALGLLKLSSHFAPFTVSPTAGSNVVSISYIDFVSIMLTAVSIILASLGLVFAIVAVVGWNTIRERVSSLATTFLQNSIKEGGELHDLVKKETQSIMYKDVEPASLADDEDHLENGESK
jgi:hypothetical protein